jgi:hypothetical protein
MSGDLMAQALLLQSRQRPRQSASSRLAAQLMQQANQTGPVYGTLGVLSRALPGVLGAYMARRGDDEERVAEKQNMQSLMDHQREQSAEAASFFGGGGGMPQQAQQMPAQPPTMPQGGGVAQGPLPPPVAAVAPPAGMYGRNAPLVAERDARLGADPIQLAAATQAGMPAGQPAFNPARPGADAPVPNWDAGLPPPTGRINPNVAPAGAPAMPPAMPNAAPGGMTGLPPGVTMDMIARGLAHPNPQIRQQAQAMVQVAQLQRREDNSALERIRMPDGSERLLPRAQAAGMVSAPPPQAPDEFQRLLSASGLDPNSPEARSIARQILERRGQPPQTNVNVDNRAEGALVQADGRALNDIQTGAQEARRLMALFDRAEAAIRSAPEGAGAQVLPLLGQAARSLGYDIPGTSEAEVLRGITTQLAVLQRAPSSGATSDMELRLYMQAVPRLGNTREGNMQLLDMGRRLMRRRLEEATIFRENIGRPDLYDRLNSLPPVFSDEERQMLAGGGGPTMGDVARGARDAVQGPAPGVTAQPPSAPTQQENLPVVTSPDQARTLPPGSRFRTPDGRVMQVPAR